MSSSTKSLSEASYWQKFKDFQIINPSDGYSQEIVFVIVLLGTAFMVTALASFSPHDPSLYNYSFPPRVPHNLCGLAGAYLAGFLIYNLGAMAFFLPWPWLWMSVQNLRGQKRAFSKTRMCGWLASFVCLLLATQQWVGQLSIEGLPYMPGGAIGYYVHGAITETLGIAGFYLVFIAGLMLAALLIHRQPLLRPLFGRVRQLLRAGKLSKKEKAAAPRDVKPENSTASAAEEATKLAAPASLRPEIVAAPSVQGPEPLLFNTDSEAALVNLLNSDLPHPDKAGASLAPLNMDEEALVNPDPSYQAPPAHLFKTSTASSTLNEEQKREFEATAESLVKSFSEFGIGGEVIAIQPGPVVTVYEFQPHAGTKLAKVTGLLDDIALALKVDSILIHPVTGKRALGVQVPNKKRETVYLGDILQSPAFKDARSPLTFALGKALNGEPVCCDLASMPHLLTAGQTGSGKSVAVNSLLCSLILKASPEQVRMILVDPKILELKVYEGIPHLLMPVITEPLKASLALKWACQEMDRRYQLMESAMVRHIGGFNQFWENAPASTRENLKERFGEIAGKLPYIVIVIDELADLMLMASKDVESSIQRLAQKARASGIHLVLATQRPSVDVITGVIKANLPCRTAFKVFSRIDSRTILDSMGAERLLGKGDMLFLRPGSTRLERIQGAFLGDEEVVAMVEHLKTSSSVHYDASAMDWIDEEYQRQASNASGSDASGDAPGQADPKWNEALGIAQRQGAISASYLQRMLKIGYNRAARIVEAMEAQGLVARADGAKPRAWIGPNL